MTTLSKEVIFLSKKKESLLKHAEQLFYDYGFHAIGLKRIISESNVALMTMYNHFESKEDLVLHVLQNREEKYMSLLKNSLPKGKSTHKPLLLAEAHAEWIQLHSSNGCLLLRAKEEYPSHQQVNTFVISHKLRLISFFQEHGLHSNEATQLAMLFEGATSLSEILDRKEATEVLIITTKRLFLS